jgi:O-antigen ligase
LPKTKNIILVYAIVAAFIAGSAYFLFEKDTFIGLATPVLLFTVLFFIFSFDKILFVIACTTPLAIDITNDYFGAGISAPTEILLLATMLAFFVKLLYEHKFDKKIISHPIAIVIIINLIWIFVTCCTSVRPVVSFKFLMARLWFVIPMFFVMTQLVKNPKNIFRFLWCYIVPLILVSGYTIVRHATYGFSQASGNWVVLPFYNDHTAYGAALALFIPLLLHFSFSKQYSKKQRFVSLMVVAFLIASMILSYCRAAWVSLFIGFVAWGVIVIRIRARYLLLVAAILTGVFFTFQHQIIYSLEKNQDDSSSDLSQHLRSITNISSDASNVERLNRWSCAIRMFHEKPIFGWGPGTYQFEYGAFQKHSELSTASTNHGDIGNAHSEYLGPLSESGLLGSLSFLTIVFLTIYYGIRVYRRQKDKKLRQIALLLTVGLITYFVHGLMNNFLDTEKLSVPFWGFIAIIVALDVYHSDNVKENQIINYEI